MLRTWCIQNELLPTVLSNDPTGRRMPNLGRVSKPSLLTDRQRSRQNVPYGPFLHKWNKTIHPTSIPQLSLAQSYCRLHSRHELFGFQIEEILERRKHFLAFCFDRRELPTTRFLRWNVRRDHACNYLSSNSKTVQQDALSDRNIWAPWVPNSQLVC